MIDRNIIGQRITALRKAHSLTQAELADRLSVTHQAVSQWERNETLPDILILPRLAEIFEVTVDHFLGMTAEETETAQVKAESEIPANPDNPPMPILSADLPERTVQIGNIKEDTSYTIVLRDSHGNETNVPVMLAEQLKIVIEGSCANVTSTLPISIAGDVEGDVTAHVVSVEGCLHGSITTHGGPAYVDGDVGGDIDCGPITVNGDACGDIDCGPITVNGDVNGDVDCGPITVNGDVNGDVDADNVTVNGELAGDLSCDGGTVTVNGDVSGDVQAEFIAATGDIDGDVHTGYAILSGTVDGDFSGNRTMVTDVRDIPWEAILMAVIERDVNKLHRYFEM